MIGIGLDVSQPAVGGATGLNLYWRETIIQTTI